MQVNYTEREAGGYTLGELEVNGQKVIISIQASPGRRICIGDHVVSNGRYANPKGGRGQVTGIREPYANDATSNVIMVVWEDRTTAGMKFEELLFEPRFTNAGMGSPVKA